MSFSNKINGCLIGYAIGDALGHGTEFMTRPEARVRYPEGLTDYDRIIRDAHRSRYRRGDYTADTQVILEMAESMIECRDVDYLHFARRYKKWFDTQEADDLDAHMRLVLGHPGFTDDPHAACRHIYERQGLYEAPNEAMGRAMLAGLWPKDIERHVTDNCRLTHWDSRCTASGLIIATMANELLWHRREVGFDHLIGIAARLDKSVLPYLETAHDGSLDDFCLDDDETFWYVRKNMGVALWALWHHTDPGEALYEVVSHGGDANANASLTMALMGLKYGRSRLPAHLIEGLLEIDVVADTAERLVDVLRHADDGADTDD